jgi:hypothetical protein
MRIFGYTVSFIFMLLADKKRKENISEYLIYLYQTEDLLRAYKFDMPDFKKKVIANIPEADREEAFAWYKGIAAKMEEEGIKESGHLKETHKIVDQLVHLHENLLKADQQYRQLFSKSAMHIRKNMEASGGQVKNPVQAALNGIYGYLLLKLTNKPVDQEIMPAVHSFGDLLSYLSYRWREKEGAH